MNILGLSAHYHDSAACLLRDGALVAAAQEERFTRRKHDASFPTHAIRYCLREGGLDGAELDGIAFYEKPLWKLERILDTAMCIAPRGVVPFVRGLPSWFVQKLRVEEQVREVTGFRGDFVYCRHHEAHAASAFFLSPFEEAAVLTVDGVGEWATNTVGVGQGHTVRMLRELRFPHSLGLLYSAFTQHLGFRVNSGEYKVMGLAPYGEPRYEELLRERLVDLKEDGSYRLRMEHFAFLAGRTTVDERFGRVLGCPPRSPDDALEQIHMDLARSIQAVTEEVLLRQARFAFEQTGLSNLCLAGGVALNSVANGRLLREGPFRRLWIQPAAGDAGGCLGAALVAWHHHHGRERSDGGGGRDGMQGALLGGSFDADEVGQALQAHGLTGELLGEEQHRAAVVEALERGDVVGWFQGRMEFGPRALGNRSILADPRGSGVQARVNAKVKFREGFRPFAPAVLEDRVSEWFELDQPSPYMLLVVQVAEGRWVAQSDEDARRTGLAKLDVVRSEIPAVTHVDRSARVQTVGKDDNPGFHALLRDFGERTGCPVLLNTSFNLRGEPIVCTPEDACRTFLASGLDLLAIGPYLVRRPAGVEPTGVPPPPPVFPIVPEPRKLRIFGLGGGGLLALLAGLFWWTGRPAVTVALAVLAAIFAGFGLAAPRLLRPVERVMGAVGRFVSRVVTTVLLTGVYLMVITPVGWLRRVVARDPLQRRIEPQRASYWEEPEQTVDHHRRMY
ncbi:MAG: carbamoyltransferase [bacterium]